MLLSSSFSSSAPSPLSLYVSSDDRTNTTNTSTPRTPPSPCAVPSSRVFSTNRVLTIPTTLCRSETSTTSSASFDFRNRILSSFNPTQTYYIPPHGGLFVRPQSLPVLKLTPFLYGRQTVTDPHQDRKAFKREAREIVQFQRGELQTCMYVKRLTGGVMILVDTSHGEERIVAKYSVPWGLWKVADIKFFYKTGNDEVVKVRTGDFDPRSQNFFARGGWFAWRFVTPRELVLEKAIDGAGKYVVAIFYLTASMQLAPQIKEWASTVIRRAIGASEGILVFDERGVDRVMCVATVLVALKRERQRKAVILPTV